MRSIRLELVVLLCSPGACADPAAGRETGTSSSGGSTSENGETSSSGDAPASSEDSGTSSESSSDEASSGAAESSSTGAPSDTPGCDYELVLEQPGVVKEIAWDDSAWEAWPLPRGHSFTCMRMRFDLQTADSQQAIVDMLDGCPIYLGIASIGGEERLASMLFKPWKVGCSPGDPRIELDTYVDAHLEHGPWPLGGLYQLEIEVKLALELEEPSSTVRVFVDGAPLGPEITASLAGATVEVGRDARVSFGMTQPADGAYFPDYGAVYSNLTVEIERAAGER